MAAQWLNCPKMNETEWLSWRRKGIGASDAPAIMEVSPWTTPFQKWEEKVVPKENQSNSSMERGKALEDPARRLFESLLDTEVFAMNVENRKDAWLRASLDGLSLDGKTMVEIKCPNRDDHFVALNKKVPEKYYPQCQHQLAVTGLEGMYYFSFDGANGVIVEVARDQSYIDSQLFPKEKQFMEYIRTETPPPLTDRDKISMENHKDWAKLAKKWKETNQMIKDLSVQDENLREQLIALSTGRSAQGVGISLSKGLCKGSVDYKRAIQEYIDHLRFTNPNLSIPDISLDAYRKPSFLKWTFRDMD